MDVPRLLIRSEVRRQRGALIALAVLVALGIGAGIAAFSIASRTDAAYPTTCARGGGRVSRTSPAAALRGE